MFPRFTFLFALSMMVLALTSSNAQVLDTGPLKRPPAPSQQTEDTAEGGSQQSITIQPETTEEEGATESETSAAQPEATKEEEGDKDDKKASRVAFSAETVSDIRYIVITVKPFNGKFWRPLSFIGWLRSDDYSLQAEAIDYRMPMFKRAHLTFEGGGRLKLQRQTNGLMSFKFSTSMPEPSKKGKGDGYAYAKADLTARVPIGKGWQIIRREAFFEDKITAGWRFSSKWRAGLLIDLAGDEASRWFSVKPGGIGADISYAYENNRSISLGLTMGMGSAPKIGFDIVPIAF